MIVLLPLAAALMAVASAALGGDLRSLEPANPAPPLTVLQTDLSPALVFRASSGRLRLFGDLARAGLGGPSHWACVSDSGIAARAVPGSATGQEMKEAWLLVWFNGGAGWDRIRFGKACEWFGTQPTASLAAFDVPWLVVLQRRPRSVSLEPGGLTLDYRGDSGYVCALPLYGERKLPAAETAAWASGLPDTVAARCRRWASLLRRVPVDCVEQYRLDHPADQVHVRQRFHYLAVDDDWRTKPARLAPLPPFLALARSAGFPVQLSAPPTDADLPTRFGPYAYVPNTDQYEYLLPGLLKWADTVRRGSSVPQVPAAQAARARLEELALKDPYAEYHFSGGYTRGVAEYLHSVWRALPYVSDAAKASLLKAVRDQAAPALLDPALYGPARDYPEPLRSQFLDEKNCGHGLDATKIISADPLGLWAYGEITGEWDALKRDWGRWRQFFHLPVQSEWICPLPQSWAGQDILRGAIMGTQGYARLAARMGDTDEYRRAAYLLAKVIVGYVAMWNWPDYVARNAPWYFNHEADYLPWHKTDRHGFTILSQDLMTFSPDSGKDGRAWQEGFEGLNSEAADLLGELVKPQAQRLFGEVLERQRPDFARAGAPILVRAYAFGDPPEKLLEWSRYTDRLSEALRPDPNRRHNFIWFQTWPMQNYVSVIERAAGTSRQRVVPPMPPMQDYAEGSHRYCHRTGGNGVPVTLFASGPRMLLAWSGFLTPQRWPQKGWNLDVYDLLPFGTVEAGAATEPLKQRALNWCTSLWSAER